MTRANRRWGPFANSSFGAVALVAGVVLLLLLPGCNRREKQMASDWQKLSTEHSQIELLRFERAKLYRELANAYGEEEAAALAAAEAAKIAATLPPPPPSPEPTPDASGALPPPPPPPPEPRSKALRQQTAEVSGKLEALYRPFIARLVAFVNRNQKHEDAIHLLSDENILVAQEYIDEVANYARAIEIYQQSLLVDPGYPPLLAGLERAELQRFVTPLSFAKLTKGMRRSEVRKLLGAPKPAYVRHIKEADREIEAWLYPRLDNGTAAIFFIEDQLYEKNYSAKEPI